MEIKEDFINQFLEREKVCALTILRHDGTPHSAALHYSHNNDDGLQIYFSMHKTSKKAEFLNNSKSALASFVAGFSEVEWKTFQADGKVVLVEDDAEIEKLKLIHYKKNPSSQKFENDPDTVYIKFLPRWYRYSDYITQPITLIETGT